MGEQIEVERDGITIGWKLVVMVAIIVLGLYVSRIVAPITEAMDRHEELLEGLQSKLAIVSAEVARATQEDTMVHKTVDELSKQVTSLNNSIIQAKEEHRSIWRVLDRHTDKDKSQAGSLK